MERAKAHVRAKEDSGDQEDGRMEDVGAAILAGCNGPPVLLSGKKILDFMTLAIQPLAVMGWFLAAATGWNARRDALLGQHLTDIARRAGKRRHLPDAGAGAVHGGWSVPRLMSEPKRTVATRRMAEWKTWVQPS